MASPSAGPAGDQTRERLDLEDFASLGDSDAFDPVLWLNSRLSRSNVPFDKLDQHLSSLGMSCQLLCQDTSESIEIASNQLMAQLAPSARDLERMRQDALKGKTRLGEVLEGLKDADDKKRSGLQGLSEIDAVKTRVETACSALREVGSWERKVKDCEQLVLAGDLPAALGQLSSLKGVLEAFRMLPEYARKEEQLAEMEEQLLSTARRRARAAVERNNLEELRSCREVFSGMQHSSDAASIANEVIQEFCERAWNSQGPGKDSSAAELASAAKAVFDTLGQALEDRLPLLQALEAQDSVSASPAGASGESLEVPKAAAVPAVAVASVKASLAKLSTKLEECIGDGKSKAQANEATAHNKASRAVALLAVFVDGFDLLAASAALSGRWNEVCRVSEGQQGEVLPWALLREVVRFVLLRPMEDDSVALAPPSRQMRPSEAVLAAESNATRLLQMPSTWARRLEQQGASQLAVPWLACVDESNAAYWRQWDGLISTFQNTLRMKGEMPPADGTMGYDQALLQECMQLHSMLHDSLAVKFATFQEETLQHVGQLKASQTGSAMAAILKEKMKDPEVWCEQLGVPSTDALRSASSLMEGSIPLRTQVLPSASAALVNAEKQVCSVVTQCCAQPVANILRGYSEMQEWTRAEDPNSEAAMMAGGMPLQNVTLVGEHLFSLVPQLEQSQDSSQLKWLPTILEAVVETVVQKVLQIKKLTVLGSQQLAVDLEYVRKVTDALGSSSGGGTPGGSDRPPSGAASIQLQELLQAVEFLRAQQRRKKECGATGQPFVEDSHPGDNLSRWAERPLRTAMGL